MYFTRRLYRSTVLFFIVLMLFDKLFNQRVHAITHHNIYILYTDVEVSIIFYYGLSF